LRNAEYGDAQRAAATLGLQVRIMRAGTPGEIEANIANLF